MQRVLLTILLLFSFAFTVCGQEPDAEPDPNAEDIPLFFEEISEAPPVSDAVAASAQTGPLSVTIYLLKSATALGEEIQIVTVYKNISSDPIWVLGVNVWGYPFTFDLTDEQGRRSVVCRAPRRSYNVDQYNDFVKLLPGEAMRRDKELTQFFIFDRPGEYNLRAVFSGFFGLPETTSNTVKIKLLKP